LNCTVSASTFVRLAGRIGLELVGVDDVVGGHRLTVVELHAWPQFERPDVAAGVCTPAGRQHGTQVEVLIGEAEILTGLGEHVEPALVGDSDRVDGARREDNARPDGGARCAATRCGGGRGRACRAAAGRCDRTEYRDGDPDDRAASDKFAPGDVAGGEFIDHVVRNFAVTLAQLAQFLLVDLVHYSSPVGLRPLNPGSSGSVISLNQSQ
jgi:hypothetical protein